MHPIAKLDQRHVWHPFTQMRDWLRTEPVVIRAGRGPWLVDVHGRRYLDGNASIWTNLHGHAHPRINRAIRRQLELIAHSSALGLANEPAARLARELVREANPKRQVTRHDLRGVAGRLPWRGRTTQPGLEKVFFSDDGSTALEVALKLAYAYSRRTGRARRPRFLAVQGAYHGDTVGAVSLGHIDLFHKAYAGLLFKSDAVMAPYCYRCPFNRARPERTDARSTRRCGWECVGQVAQRMEHRARRGEGYAGMVVEPLMQGAAGMIAQPAGWLRQVADLARAHGALLIADEVMTGFGRTGRGLTGHRSLMACHREGVQPDFLALAKGLTGGYLPMAATLTTQKVFDAFLGEYEEFKTFFHGHSYTGNQLGAAAGLASLEILRSAASHRARAALERAMGEKLESLWCLPHVGDIRREGLMVGVELVRDWRTREAWPLQDRVGMRVCDAMRRRGVLTRPIGNVVPLIPPYIMTPSQAGRMVDVLAASIREVLGDKPA